MGESVLIIISIVDDSSTESCHCVFTESREMYNTVYSPLILQFQTDFSKSIVKELKGGNQKPIPTSTSGLSGLNKFVLR